MKYEVRLEKFNGPLDRLLELIEARQLEITQINLAEVTGDFLKYIESLGSEAGVDVFADFLVVAGKLILIKSKALLPNLDLTEEEKFLLLESDVGEGIFFAGMKHVAIKILASYTEDQIITSDPSQLLAIKKAKEDYQQSNL